MNAKVLLILLLVIALVAGIGVAIFLLTRQPESVSGPSITTPGASTSPSSAPSATSAELSVDSESASFTIGETATVDIYLDTKGENVDGFQFIANLSGSALPAVVDTDPDTQGVQIAPAPIPNMTVATNTVTTEGDRSVIRFAMLLDDSATQSFSSTTPTKIASLQVTPGSGGTISIDFSSQNSRVRLESTRADALATTTSNVFTVAGEGGVAQVDTTIADTQTTTPTSPTPNAIAPFCLQSCVSDNDCAAGLVCEADRCVNPACATSSTCSCTQTTTTTPVTSPTAVPVVTPKATLIAQATLAPTQAPVEVATDSALPTAGSVEVTLLMVGAGLLLFGTGVVLASNRATLPMGSQDQF